MTDRPIINFELLFWIMALTVLGLSDPASECHFTLCPLKMLGFNWCPGCGMGHAIAYLLHGDVAHSFKAHWLGLPALGIILYRVYDLLYKQIYTFRKLKSL